MTLPARWDVPEPLAVCEVRATDGASIFVRRHGNPNGPRFVLSHGNGFSIDAYYPFWSRFIDRFDIFVYDIRNHGWNPVGDRRAHHVPNFVSDGECVVREIDRRFGEKPKIGLFHSLSVLIALHQAAGSGGFAALVLFDPPICPSGGFPRDMDSVGHRLGTSARRRRDRFSSPEDYAERLSRRSVFERLHPGAIELFARTTLRRAADGTGYELRCPREYEAQIYEYIYCWSGTVELESVPGPIKAIGADPVVSHSYMPSIDFKELQRFDYDFIPETTHLLLLEKPDACADLVLDFLESRGLV